MGRSPAQIHLTEHEQATLRDWTRGGARDRRIAERALIILLSSEGMRVEKIAEHLGTRAARVSKWRQRFAEDRLRALSDAPRSGKPQKYPEDIEKRVLTLLESPAPQGQPGWSGALLAQVLGDVSNDRVWRILRKRGIRLRRPRVCHTVTIQ